MFQFFRDEPTLTEKLSDRIVPLALGATAGLAAGLLFLRRTGRGRGAGEMEAGIIDLEERIVDRLVADDVIGDRPVDVGTLSEGIIELTGSVHDEDEMHRAVWLAQGTPGVRTVLNRLDIGPLEEHLAETRERFQQGDPALTETHWYGNRVGTGLRRQGRETDPDRSSDKVSMMESEFGVDKALEQASEPLDKLAPAVEGHTSSQAEPTRSGQIDDASHRRLGNVPSEPLQDYNAVDQVHENVKPGTELTIEQAEMPVRDEVRDEVDEVQRGLNQ